VRTRYRMAFVPARMSALPGRPSGRAGGIIGSSRAQLRILQVARLALALPPINVALRLRPHRCSPLP
jgi:hypothetical protein